MNEIERKFLVAEMPGGLGDGEEIRQAYLALDGEVEVRVRERAGERRLTIKSGRGLERAEVELELSEEQAGELWSAAEPRSIEKTRFTVEIDGATAEIDVYSGRLEGLSVVEIEFPSREVADAFRAPDWFGAELTDDERYSNASLAQDGMPDARRPAGR